MEDADVYAISVEVAPRFLDDQSAPEDGRYAFADLMPPQAGTTYAITQTLSLIHI